MTGPARWRLLVASVAVTSAALVLVTSRIVIRKSSRLLAERTARSVASYVALVARSRRQPGRGYDLAELLIRARGLDALPKATPDIEVYATTAPLVHATAAPLAPAALARLRDTFAVTWQEGTVLAPLRSPGDSHVVGAVGVRASPLPLLWPGGFAVPALLFLLPAALQCARRLGTSDATRAFESYLLTALIFGAAAYGDTRVAALEARRRWLADTRTLIQEAAHTGLGPTELRTLAGDGALLPRGSGHGPGDAGSHGSGLLVRLGSARLAELRAPPDFPSKWLVGLLGLALVGPATARLTMARAATPRGTGGTAGPR